MSRCFCVILTLFIIFTAKVSFFPEENNSSQNSILLKEKTINLISEKKDPFASAMFSLIYSGVGQFYNRQYTTGSILFFGETLYHVLNFAMMLKFQNTYSNSSISFFSMDNTDKVLLCASILVYTGLKAYSIYDAYNYAVDLNKEIEKSLNNISFHVSPREWMIVCSVKI